MTGEELLLLRTTQAGPFPPVPTREQVCRVQMSFQGLTVDVGQGPIGWFEAALCCLNVGQRQTVYAAKHAAGDTHALVLFTAGVMLYPEPNQPYQNYQCPNYEAHPDQFVALVEEVRRAGFIPAVFFDERQAEASRLMPLAIFALQHGSSERDLNQDVIYSPGFDGVFYGWDPPSLITDWGRTARRLGAHYLALEFNTGHIPQEGGVDVTPFDALLIEFERDLHNWNNWQIVSRLIGEAAYQRPADDTSPHPVPAVDMSTPRGPIHTIGFEYKTYWWVRGQNTAAEIAADRAYLLAEGCPTVC